MTGPLEIRPLHVDGDAGLVHDWVTRDYARFWGMQGASLDDVRREYREIAESPHHAAFLGLDDGEPAFLVERYDPAHHEINTHYDVADGDVGMHFLVAPTDHPVPGFTLRVLRAVMELLFSDPATVRVVVEPDVRNVKVAALNKAVGFEVVTTITLHDKDAALSTCTRDHYLSTFSEEHPR